jgi:outer membrane protein insertion porin family/translocation and assembly module TamA
VRTAAWLAAGVLCLIAGRAPAQGPDDVECDPGDPEVVGVSFSGNRTFRSDFLANGIATTPSSWWRRTFRVIGQRFCYDSMTVVRDSARLAAFYRQNGFAAVKVGYALTRPRPRTVALRFRIEEGPPVLIDSLEFLWHDANSEPLPPGSVPESERVLRGLPVAEGSRFSVFSIEAARDSITRRLRNRGYPLVEVFRSYQPSDTAGRMDLSFVILPGPRARIEAVNVEVTSTAGGGESAFDTSKVRRVLGIRPGQLYNEQLLAGVKRSLFLTEAFVHVDISPDSVSLYDAVDSLVTIDVKLVAQQPRAARVSVGWGNLDCARAQGSYTDYGFLRALRRLDLNVRVSKVGIDPPLDFAGGLCTRQVRNDPLSDTLNYYVGATISQPALFGLRVVPSLTIYSERRSEYQAFLRSTPVGVIGFIQQGIDGALPMSWSYQLEYGRTVAQPAFFCAVFNVCEDATRAQLERLSRTAVLGWSLTRNRADDLVSPTRGSVLRIDLRHASPIIGSGENIQFNSATIDGSAYYRVFGSGSLAFRIRAGTVLGNRLSFSAGARFVPPQERLYAGGPNTVRGFRQNELGPAIYIPDDFEEVAIPGDDTLAYFRADPAAVGERVVPTGGDNLVVANAELRLRSVLFPDLVQWALFVDAGQVWNKGRAATGVGFRDLRITPGVGMRVFSDLGPIRVDVGYNGYDRPPGAAYFTPSPVGASGDEVIRLICVSPGNTLRVRKETPTSPARQIDIGDCPATYAPARRNSFFSRLTWQFSIGQPF